MDLRLKTRRRICICSSKRVLVCALAGILAPSFTVSRSLQRRGHPTSREAVEAEVVQRCQSDEDQFDYVLPVGPACPFRSEMMVRGNFEQDLAMLHLNAASKSGEFDALVRQIAAGIQPDPRQKKKVGFDLKQQGDHLKSLLDDMEDAVDFQVIESYHLMELKAKKMGAISARTVEKMTSWQGTGIMAEADGMMVPPPPIGVDPVALSKAAPAGRGGWQSQPNAPRVLPFEEESFLISPEARLLGAEYAKLSKEHGELVNFGGKFGDFDQAGKEFYIDKMLEVTTRWSSLLSDTRRLGIEPVRPYVAFSQEYLGQSGLSPQDFREMVDEVHQLLRRKADPTSR
ncbi:unnamed protein product [Durusdinium trenchii]